MAKKITLYLDPELIQPVEPCSISYAPDGNIQDVRVYVPVHGECILVASDELDADGQPIYKITPKK